MRGLGMADRFFGLRHDAVVGGHHENNQIRDLRAARAHLCERGMARRVEERDLLAVLQLHLIGADMLGDAAGFARDHIGLAQRIEQRSLAVVDMAHDGDDRRTGRHLGGVVVFAFQTFENVGFGDALDGVAVFGGDEFGGVGIDHIVLRDHHAVFHQHLDDVDRAARHAVRKFGDRDGFRNRDFARTGGTGSLLLLAFVQALQMTLVSGDRTGALAAVIRQGARDGQLATATVFAARLACGWRFGRNLAARTDLLWGLVFFFVYATRARRFGRHGRARTRRFAADAARGFFFRVFAGLFLDSFALFFLNLAAERGLALLLQQRFFFGAAARIFLSLTARFFFMHARIGKRRTAAGFLFFRQLAQNDTGTRIAHSGF